MYLYKYFLFNPLSLIFQEEVGEFISGIGKTSRNEETAISPSIIKVACPPPPSQPRVKMVERRRKISIQSTMGSQDNSLSMSDDNAGYEKDSISPNSSYLTKRGMVINFLFSCIYFWFLHHN